MIGKGIWKVQEQEWSNRNCTLKILKEWVKEDKSKKNYEDMIDWNHSN